MLVFAAQDIFNSTVWRRFEQIFVIEENLYKKPNPPCPEIRDRQHQEPLTCKK
jgi:hypothetical protein